jgi:hypothetical protein
VWTPLRATVLARVVSGARIGRGQTDVSGPRRSHRHGWIPSLTLEQPAVGDWRASVSCHTLFEFHNTSNSLLEIRS